MLRYIRGMDLQTSPFPPFRGRDRLIAAVDAAMSSGDPERITTDLQLALHAQQTLAVQGIAVRVVSMPSTSVFDRQPRAYKEAVLPAGLPRIAVEAGVTDGWWKYGVSAVVGIDTYGESAPANVLFKHFGFTPENVADTVKVVLGKARLKG